MGWDLLLPPWTRFWDLHVLPSGCWAHIFKLLQGIDYRPASRRLESTQQENGDHPAWWWWQWAVRGNSSSRWPITEVLGDREQEPTLFWSDQGGQAVTASQCPCLSDPSRQMWTSPISSAPPPLPEERNGKIPCQSSPFADWGRQVSPLWKGGEEKRRITPRGTSLR